jgi:hypothetical protein
MNTGDTVLDSNGSDSAVTVSVSVEVAVVSL